MIITISGNPGSGKSTIAKALEKELGYKRYYMGGIFRELARKRGITIEQILVLADTDPSIDKEVDEYQINLRDEDNIIIEGRTSFHLIPNSLKIFITVNEEEAAKRIFRDLHDKSKSNERNQDEVTSIAEMIKKNKEREEGEIKRYKKYYGIENSYDLNNYDLVIDTTKGSIQESIDDAILKTKEAMKELKQ